MNCEEIRDLLAAFVFGTLAADEEASVRSHIEHCREHDVEIAELRQTTSEMASSVDAKVPPPDLKRRVMEHARRNSIPVIGLAELPRRRTWFGLPRVVSTPIAAALVVVIGVMAVWNVTLQTTYDPERFTHYYWGNDNDWMRVETVLGESGADVSLGGIDRLDESQLYHLWTTRGETVLLVGAFNVNPEGKWAGEFEFTFFDGDRLWITAEPVSGSEQPTGEAVLRTRF
jgi:anti-sigma-K factor RskA